jgi:hypothetical protein
MAQEQDQPAAPLARGSAWARVATSSLLQRIGIHRHPRPYSKSGGFCGEKAQEPEAAITRPPIRSTRSRNPGHAWRCPQVRVAPLAVPAHGGAGLWQRNPGAPNLNDSHLVETASIAPRGQELAEPGDSSDSRPTNMACAKSAAAPSRPA